MVEYLGPAPSQSNDLVTKGYVDGGLNGKAPLASPAFTGTVTGVSKAMVGLGNVDNTADLDKPLTAAAAPLMGVPRSNLGDPSVFEVGMIDAQMVNRMWFYPTTAFVFETSPNDSTWTPFASSTLNTSRLVSGNSNGSINFAKNSYFRTTITNAGGYVYLNYLYLWLSTNGSKVYFKLEKRNASTGAWSTVVNYGNGVSTWPGHMTLSHPPIPFNQSTSTSHYTDVRLTIKADADTSGGTYPNITLSGLEWWGGYPSGKRTIYSWDEDKNVYFPSAVVTPNLSTDAITGNPAFTGSPTGLSKAMVGLGSVDDTADSAKPVSTAQAAADTAAKARANHSGTQVAATISDFSSAADARVAAGITGKANLASPTFTGTVGGVTAAMVGLGSVNNTADSAKPVSTAQAAADTAAKARANHSGTQLASTISDFAATADARVVAGITGKADKTTVVGQESHDIKLNPATMTGQVGTQLIIPTHVSPAGGQLVHPSVVYYEEGWNGYKYWMGHTPYPSGNDSSEDPNVVCSHDGVNWVVPAGLTNPLDDAPGSPGSYNSDTCMAKGPDNVLHLFWRSYDSTLGSNQEKMWMATSTNGYQWTAKVLIHQSTQTVRRLVSPALIWDVDRWIMFAVDILPSPNVMVRMRAVNAIPNNWDAPTIIPIGTMLSGKEAWHLSMRRVGSQYVGLLNDCVLDQSGAGGELLMLTSDDDGWSFINSGKTIIPKVAASKHDQLYHSTFVPTFRDGILGLEVWYSAWLTSGPIWNVYKTWVGPTATPPRIDRGKISMGTLGAGGFYSLAVVFPGGAFPVPPAVLVSTDSGRTNSAAIAVTTTGFTFGVNNWTAAGTSALQCNWTATAI